MASSCSSEACIWVRMSWCGSKKTLGWLLQVKWELYRNSEERIPSCLLLQATSMKTNPGLLTFCVGREAGSGSLSAGPAFLLTSRVTLGWWFPLEFCSHDYPIRLSWTSSFVILDFQNTCFEVLALRITTGYWKGMQRLANERLTESLVSLLGIMYLLGWKGGKEGEKERANTWALWSASSLLQMPATTMTGIGLRSEPGIQPRSPSWVAGAQLFEPLWISDEMAVGRELEPTVNLLHFNVRCNLPHLQLVCPFLL